MTKQLNIDPEKTLSGDKLRPSEILIHGYNKQFKDERKYWGDSKLIELLRHMLIVREFETMLHSFKSTGSYRGIDYLYKGPAHLSVGQEAVVVGSAAALEPEDKIFGSHRSHGEIIAKGLSAISNLDKKKLHEIMVNHKDGKLLSLVQDHLKPESGDDAEMFLLMGILAEIFMRDAGFNKGMGGSMHAFFTPFGAYPNNAIVGGSSGIAVGAALFSHLSQDDGICVANLGDGSTGCGLVWESMNFSAMSQFKTLWSSPFNTNPPILFCFTNNFYAMGGQTSGETMAWDRLSRIGAGLNAEQFHAETVNGSDPLAVADAISRKREILQEGNGPALLDIECYRFSGHSTTDTNAYRSREEIKAWKLYDPIESFQRKIISEGLLTETAVTELIASVGNQIEAITRVVVDRKLVPAIDIKTNPTVIGDMTFNEESIELTLLADDLLMDPAGSKHQQSIKKKARFGFGKDGSQLSGMRAVTLRDSLSESILHHLTHDKSLIAYGEECRDWGGAFGVYRGFADVIPNHRLFNAPISEAAIVSTGIGYALAGGRSLIELMYADFIGRAGDEIFNQLAKWQAMSAGELRLPVVLRTSIGSKYGAQHSQDWTSLLAHIPGLRILYPATPYDAKGLMATALAGNDPTVVFESQRLYDRVEIFVEKGVPESYFRLPFGKAVVRRKGDDVTILTIGPSLYPTLEAVREMQTHGISAEVIDARTLVPFDYESLINSVNRTGRLLIVSEAVERGSFSNTIATNVMRLAFDKLKAAPIVLGAPNWIAPGADMEDTYAPQIEDIFDSVFGEFFPDKRVNKRGIRSWDFIKLAGQGL